MKIVYLNELTKIENDIYFNSKLYLNIVNSKYQYSKSAIYYYNAYFGNDYQNYTLIIFNNDEPILVSYSFSNQYYFSFFNDPIQILSIKLDFEIEHKAYKLLIDKWEELFIHNNFSEIIFYSNKHLNSKFHNFILNNSLKINLLIDLQASINIIQSSIRKSYKSLINWGRKNIIISIIDSTNLTLEKFNQYKNLHIHAAGRQTRDDLTWEKQFDSIKFKEGVLLLSEYNNTIVGATYLMLGSEISYYGVGAYNRNLMESNLPISHFSIFASIEYLKSLKIKYYNLGYILSENTNEKEKNIFNFKKGFTDNIKYKIIHHASLKYLDIK